MPREIDDDEIVTQYGNRETDPVFHTRPKPGGRRPRAMSVTLGQRAPEEMVPLVGRSPDPPADTARYARVGRLRHLGFRVTHTPTGNNADHVSVEWPRAWDDTVAEGFDSCFEEADG